MGFGMWNAVASEFIGNFSKIRRKPAIVSKFFSKFVMVQINIVKFSRLLAKEISTDVEKTL